MRFPSTAALGGGAPCPMNHAAGFGPATRWNASVAKKGGCSERWIFAAANGLAAFVGAWVMCLRLPHQIVERLRERRPLRRRDDLPVDSQILGRAREVLHGQDRELPAGGAPPPR